MYSAFVKKAFHLVRINVPYLAELTHDIELIATNEIDTAGVFASGRLIYNPDWLEKLSLRDATFVFAHEVMHLALNSHQRSGLKDKALFNVTHDFIINELLKETFGMNRTPAGGLDWEEEYSNYYDIKGKPAEELMKFIKDALENGLMNTRIFTKHWGAGIIWTDAETNTPLAEELKQLFPNKNKEDKARIKSRLQKETDILDEKFEREFFPEITNRQIRDKQQIIKAKASRALSARLVLENASEYFSLGSQAGGAESIYEAITTLYQPPWEVALQKWIENTQRSGKTYSRPSRRGQYSHFVRPGYLREGNTLHIVVDTSGSMAGILGKVLGVISSFCETMNIPEIRIIQCDTQVSEDKWYYPEELRNFKINGFGGSDMSPGLMKLAEDNQVEYAVVITDGYISYPKKEMPFEVLWVLTEKSWFKPTYGTVIQLTGD